MSHLDSTSQRHCDQQEQLAKEHQAEAARQVNDYKRELETQFGIPIVFEKLGANHGAGGTARAVWNQRIKCGHHSIDLRPGSEWLAPAGLAHELMHLELECRAESAGVRRTPAVWSSPEIWTKFRLRGQDEHKDLISYSMNVPLDMVVDAGVMTKFPILKPAMFVEACRFQEKNTRTKLRLGLLSPRYVDSANSLRGVSALFTDLAYGKMTDFFARFRNIPEAKVIRRLHDAFVVAFPLKHPDGHYQLVETFDGILGLPELHQWDSRPTWELCHRPADVVVQAAQSTYSDPDEQSYMGEMRSDDDSRGDSLAA